MGLFRCDSISRNTPYRFLTYLVTHRVEVISPVLQACLNIICPLSISYQTQKKKQFCLKKRTWKVLECKHFIDICPIGMYVSFSHKCEHPFFFLLLQHHTWQNLLDTWFLLFYYSARKKATETFFIWSNRGYSPVRIEYKTAPEKLLVAQILWKQIIFFFEKIENMYFLYLSKTGFLWLYKKRSNSKYSIKVAT